MSARDQVSIRWKPGLTLDIDPESAVRYTWHWEDRLTDGEDIDTYEFVVDGIGTVEAHARNGNSIMCLLSGIPQNARTTVTCRVTTTGNPPERLDRSVLFVGRHS